MFGGDPNTWYDLSFGGGAGLGEAVPGLAAGAIDPDSVLSLLQGADGEVENLGTEDAPPVSRATISASTPASSGIADGATEQLDDETGSDVSDLRSTFEDELARGVARRRDPGRRVGLRGRPDPQGRGDRRRRSAEGRGGENAETTLSFEMYDLGADIAIEVPTDAKKLDFGDLLGGLGRCETSPNRGEPPTEPPEGRPTGDCDRNRVPERRRRPGPRSEPPTGVHTPTPSGSNIE